jgi:hypothetical protein
MKRLVRSLCLLTVLVGRAVLAATTEIGAEDDTLLTVPKGVRDATGFTESRGLAGEKCRLKGKRINLQDPAKKLWFATNTCGGSGGQAIYLVYEMPTPKLVLDAGTSLELTVQEEQSHGLPDVVVVSGGNCCGISSDRYRFDGKAYQGATHAWTGEFEKWSVEEVPPQVAATVRNKGAKKDCSVNSGQIAGTENNPTALLVFSSCESEDNYSVWVVMLSPTPHVILQAQSADEFSMGPESSVGLPDLCFGATDGAGQQECWRFDSKVYVRR